MLPFPSDLNHLEICLTFDLVKKQQQECLSALCHASFVDVYLAYLRSYGHLKIVKCIGIY